MPILYSVRILLTLLLLANLVGADECPVPNQVPIYSVELEGIHHTRPGVIYQALEHRVGKTFSCALWVIEKNRLKDLDIFASITLQGEVKRDAQGDSVKLKYQFTELPPYIPLASINKTDQDGLSLGPALISLNFLGTGKRLEAMARFFGTTEYQVSLSGRQLWEHAIEFDMAWIHVDSYNPNDHYHEDSHRLKADGIFPLAWGLGLAGFGELFTVKSDTILLRPGRDWVPRLGIGLRWDGRDRALQPRKGVFMETRMTQNGGFLGGPADYWEELIDIRAYTPLFSRFSLMANTLYQYRNLGKVGSMGAYENFHVGGANTLRGYETNVMAGRNEHLINAEFRWDLVLEKTQKLGPWSLQYALQLVSGLDGASLWNSDKIWDNAFAFGPYVGMHILIPGLDRLRFEVGMHGFRGDVLWHFGLFEKTTVQRFRTR